MTNNFTLTSLRDQQGSVIICKQLSNCQPGILWCVWLGSNSNSHLGVAKICYEDAKTSALNKIDILLNFPYATVLQNWHMWNIWKVESGKKHNPCHNNQEDFDMAFWASAWLVIQINNVEAMRVYIFKLGIALSESPQRTNDQESICHHRAVAMLEEKCIKRKKSIPCAPATSPLVSLPCTVKSVRVSEHWVITHDSFHFLRYVPDRYSLGFPGLLQVCQLGWQLLSLKPAP